jgi:hypothetical protein
MYLKSLCAALGASKAAGEHAGTRTFQIHELWSARDTILSMFNISDYLKKFVKMGDDIVIERSSIELAIIKIVGIQKPRFEVKKGILYINVPPVAKSLVFTKKKALLDELKKTAAGAHIYEVR